MTPRERFLRALKRQPTDRPAVGNPTSIVTTDLMDLTGISFPDVHHDPEKMARLALAGHEVLGYDTVAPYFSVAHEAAALGANIDWGTKERMPAVRPGPGRTYRFQSPEQILLPPDFLQRPSVVTILEAIRSLRSQCGNDVAIVGKAFGPWTLAYHLFGIENFLMLTVDEPEQVHGILTRLSDVTVAFGRAQMEAGADCITLADHLTGDLCRPETYRDFLLPAHQRLGARLDCPIILHICGYTLDRLDYVCSTGFEAFHFDSKNDAKKAAGIVRNRMALIGNVNNPDTLYRGREDRIRSEVTYALDAGVRVIGPECAVPLTARYQHIRQIMEVASTYQPKPSPKAR